MTMMYNIVCVPNIESGTKCPKMTTPQYGCFRMPIELSEKIRMLAMDTFKGGCWEIENVYFRSIRS